MKWLALTKSLAVTDPSALTGYARTNCPDESTTYLSLLTLNEPFRVYTVCVDVKEGWRAKNPWPEIAKSNAFKEELILPWVNCCFTPLRIVPEPIDDDAFWRGEVAKISPNSARDLLKPVVFTLAILFEVADISDCEPFSPVNAV